MKLDGIQKQLGEGYNDKILTFLGSDRVIEHGYAPTWWITGTYDWRNKSYWVRKALNKLQAENKVESFKHRNSVGWCWALKGKLNRG